MSEYKLTIVIPTYNSEKTIKKAFNSVQVQTIGFENIELIFVDDKSKDNTLTLLKSYENEYGNIKVFETDENSGFAGTPRNIGLKNSNSKYILFLDSDDELSIDACEVLFNEITQNSSDIVIGAFINQYSNFKKEHNPPLYSGNKELFNYSKDVNLLDVTPAISAKLFKNELLIENNILFIEGAPAQDLAFLIEYMLNSNKISVLNNYYAYMRNVNENSVSMNVNKKYLYGLINTLNIVLNLFKNHNITSETQKIIFNKHLYFLTTQFMRFSNSEKFDESELNEILNSTTFKNFQNQDFFKDDESFEDYLNNLKNGKYEDNHLLLKDMRKQFNNNSINDYSNLKNEINILKNENSELNIILNESKNEINELCEEKSNLLNENENLKNEINEIKSSRIWKLKNKL